MKFRLRKKDRIQRKLIWKECLIKKMLLLCRKSTVDINNWFVPQWLLWAAVFPFQCSSLRCPFVFAAVQGDSSGSICQFWRPMTERWICSEMIRVLYNRDINLVFEVRVLVDIKNWWNDFIVRYLLIQSQIESGYWIMFEITYNFFQYPEIIHKNHFYQFHIQ